MYLVSTHLPFHSPKRLRGPFRFRRAKFAAGVSLTCSSCTNWPMGAMILAAFEFPQARSSPVCIISTFVQTMVTSAYSCRRKRQIIFEIGEARARSNSVLSFGTEMKWLFNNWCGRLYLVLQVTCLVITIFLCVRFRNDDQEREKTDISESWGFFGVPRADGKFPPPDVYARGAESVDRIRKKHGEDREKMTLFYLSPNLAVPLFFGVGLFIAKGLPKQKSAN